MQTFVTKMVLQPLDTTPPLITISVTPKILWPPNGSLVRVTVFGQITDAGSGVDRSSVSFAVRDEYRRVQPIGPVTMGPGGTYSFNILLQASRVGTDFDGRKYTITVYASDNAGNKASKSAIVTVVHDQGN